MPALPPLHELKSLFYPLSMIAFLGIPVGESRLAALCQVDRRTARSWLTSLAGLGYLVRQYTIQGYVLTPLARQTLAPFLTQLWENLHPDGEKMPTPDHNLPSAGENMPSPGENLPIPAPTTADSLAHNHNECLKAADPSNGKNIPITGEILPTIPKPLGEAPAAELLPASISEGNIAILRSCGIGEPKRSNLARLPWMAPAYIHAWRDHLRQRRSLSPGLLIHCLESGSSPPDPEPAAAAAGPDTAVLDRLLQSCTASSVFTHG